MIKIKNVSSSNATIICKDLRFRRALTPGREIPLNKEVYDELSFDPGFQAMVQMGIIRVSGAAEENAEEIVSAKKVLSREEIKEIFNNKDYAQFARMIQNASPATKESITSLAVEMRIADNGFVSLINKYCDYDVLAAMANQE